MERFPFFRKKLATSCLFPGFCPGFSLPFFVFALGGLSQVLYDSESWPATSFLGRHVLRLGKSPNFSISSRLPPLGYGICGGRWSDSVRVMRVHQ
jgi:hypothetical protein